MQRQEVPTGTTQQVQGAFTYLSDSTTPSLFRNGKVLTRRNTNGSDSDWEGVQPVSHTLPVFDARAASPRKTCEHNGFELLDAPMEARAVDFFDHREVATRYYPECADLVRSATGAREVYAFDHNIRSAQGKRTRQRIAGGQEVQGPAKMVHGDYTLVSAPQRLRDLARPLNANDTLRPLLPEGATVVSPESVAAALAPGGRFAIINVWRSIAPEPVQINPLAMCDSQTVAPEDLVTFEIHYADRVGENYFAIHRPSHAFWFYPEMTSNEPLLLKQWDSEGPLARSDGAQGDASEPDSPCTFSFHTAFDVDAPEDAPDRLSIEVRCMVVY